MIRLYTGATAGAADGTEVSNGRTFLTPIEASLNAGESESKIIPVGVRGDSGYTYTDVTITTDIYSDTAAAYTGTTDSMVQFSINADGSDAAEVLSLDSISTTNTIFYIVITSSTLQNPSINKATAIKVSYTATPEEE